MESLSVPMSDNDEGEEAETAASVSTADFLERDILIARPKSTEMTSSSVFNIEEPDKVANKKGTDNALFFRINETPFWPTAIMFGFQQLMVCISGVISSPLIISDIICAQYIPLVRVKLVGTMMFIAGFSTILQSTFGTRLPLLQGPSFAFIPPIVAMMGLDEYKCTNFDTFMKEKFENDTINPDYNVSLGAALIAEIGDKEWISRMQVIQGTLVAAAVVQMLVGATGMIGFITKFIGPLTIAPLMLLLEISVVPICLHYVTSHWTSGVVVLLLLLTALYMNRLRVPLPSYSRKRKCEVKMQPIFAMFPYLIAILSAWILCLILTETGVLPNGSKGRTDLRSSVLTDAPWVRWPYPGQWGPIGFNVGVFFGLIAATLSSIIESVGDYHACARVCQEQPPPGHAVNRGIFMEGFCCFIGGFLGSGLSVTTYSENVGVIGLTKVASRTIFQITGLILIILGVFTKVGAIFATIPDPIVGGILTVSLAMVGGVGLSSIQLVDLRLSRNIAILGLAIMIGLQVPSYVRDNPINTGIRDLDQVLTILLTIDMFVGGMVGFFLDNTVPGATLAERGLKAHIVGEATSSENDAYAFPELIMHFLRKIPGSKYIPLLPTYAPPDNMCRRRVQPKVFRESQF